MIHEQIMSNSIVRLYRELVPKKLRSCIYKLFLGEILFFLGNYRECLLCRWYFVYYLFVKPKSDQERSYQILGKMGLSPYPYLWRKEYDKIDIPTYIDTENGLPYVIHKNKRLYFRKDMSDITSNLYRSLLIEQDQRSAHCYVHSCDELKNKILLDVGSAEAYFTLDMIEYIEHAYLFECDENWIEALNATFKPWSDKVTIVRKYVSDNNEDSNITLDDFFKDKIADNLFIKMDIEGYERKALQGCEKLLKESRNLSGAICIYHLHDDEAIIKEYLHNRGCEISVQPGYLYFEKEMRHAILRFEYNVVN